MDFFETYDASAIPAKGTVFDNEEYKTHFVQQWYQKNNMNLIIPIHPILPSRLVIPPRLALEQELMKVKMEIDAFHNFDKEKERYYNQATRIIDPFSHFRTIVRKNVFPEKSMTNAWLKCWEMLHTFQLIPYQKNVRVFCNAELPGAFLFAIHHYVLTNTGATLDWVANSLYPSDGSILGDEFGLVERFPDRWLMDKEHSGSVTEPAMMERMKERCGRNIDLYTSDIGIGLDYDTFAKQEELEAPLHLGQLICGLVTLKEGGHLVCKTFMFFSAFSISLMYLVSQCFEWFYIHKPQTSRPANSEVYVIGKGFRHTKETEEITALLMEHLTTWNSDKMDTYMVPVPESFYLTVYTALHQIYQRQINYIRQNIKSVSELYTTGPAQFHHVRTHPFYQSEQQRLQAWKKKFNIPIIRECDAL